MPDKMEEKVSALLSFGSSYLIFVSAVGGAEVIMY